VSKDVGRLCLFHFLNHSYILRRIRTWTC